MCRVCSEDVMLAFASIDARPHHPLTEMSFLHRRVKMVIGRAAESSSHAGLAARRCTHGACAGLRHNHGGA